MYELLFNGVQKLPQKKLKLNIDNNNEIYFSPYYWL